MKRNLLITVFILWAISLIGVSLQDCLSALRENSPISKNLQELELQAKMKDKALQKAYLPNLSLSAEAGANSEVTRMSLGSALPLKAPVPDKDREAVGLELRQLVWDAGITKGQRQLSSLEMQAKKLDYQSSLQAQEMELLNRYFEIIGLDLSQQTLALNLDSMNARERALQAGLESGVRERADLLLLQSDILKLEDRIEGLKRQREAAVQRINRLCGMELEADMEFMLPQIPSLNAEVLQRAELSKLDVLAKMQRENSSLAKRKNLPQVSARVSGAYGKPGYDMFSTQFHDYYSAGIVLSWKLWDWGQRSYESKVAESEAGQLERSKENMELNIRNELLSLNKETEQLVHSTGQIARRVALLEDVQRIYEEKYELGTLGTTELLLQNNSLLEAKLELQSTKTKLRALEAKKIYIMGDRL